jgi:glycosyltransferase involved in cell wall biosynthesis
MQILLYKIKNNLINTDIASAESNFSLNILKKISSNLNLFLSPNGNDDEIEYFNKPMLKENIAIILGTYKYKSLDKSFKVFQSIQIKNPNVKLLIIGNQDDVPLYIKNSNNVNCLGLLNREDVLKYLKLCKYYISTTKLENSYNAAAEGAYFADESFISNIEPHLELFKNIEYKMICIDSFNLIHIEKNKLNLNNLYKWDYLFNQITTLTKKVNYK